MNLTTGLFLKLLPTQIFIAMTSSLGNIVDGLLVGNLLPADAMVSLGFVAPVATVLSAISMAVSGGSRVLCGRAVGRGEPEELKRIYTSALSVLFAIGAVLMVFGVFFHRPIAGLLGAQGATVEGTAAYLRAYAVGFLPLLMIPCLMVFLQVNNDSRFNLLATLLLVVVNAGLSLLAVLVFHWGLPGSGYATSASEYVTAVVLLRRIRKKCDGLRFERSFFSLGCLGTMLKLGCPGALANLLYALRNILLNSFALKLGGADAVGALAVLQSSSGPFDALSIGTNSTLLILASLAVGERDTKRLRDLLKVSVIVGLCLSAFRIVIGLFFAGSIAELFGAAGERLAMARTLLIIYHFAAPFDMISSNIMTVDQALGKVGRTNLLYVFKAFVVSIGLCFVFSFVGVVIVWLSFPIGELLTVLLLVGLYAGKHRKIPASLGDFVEVAPDFEQGASIHFTVRSMEDVVHVAEKVQSFFREQGIDDRRSMFSGLCLEEMSANVVRHGFPKSHRPGRCSVDVFARCEGGEMMLRLQDNAPPFNPKERLAFTPADDPLSNFGIRTVAKIAKEIAYQSNFGLNVLTVSL